MKHRVHNSISDVSHFEITHEFTGKPDVFQLHRYLNAAGISGSRDVKNVSNLPTRPDLCAHTLNNKWMREKVSHTLRHSIRRSAFWKPEWSHLWSWSEDLYVKNYYFLRLLWEHLKKKKKKKLLNAHSRCLVFRAWIGACICTYFQILFFIYGSFTGSSNVCGSWSRYSNHTMSTELTIKESCNMSVVCINVDGQHLFWRLGCCHRRQLWIS